LYSEKKNARVARARAFSDAAQHIRGDEAREVLTLCEVLVTAVLFVPVVKTKGLSQENTRFEVLTAVLAMFASFLRCDAVLVGNLRRFE
jgi:hypothetical protein